MTPNEMQNIRAELEEFLDYVTHKMGRTERREALGSYIRGLLLDGERKSMTPIAERVAPTADEVEAVRQRLQQAISVACWDEFEIFRRIALRVEQDLPEVDAFVIDDTGFAKKGRHSVGVHRQYSGTLGRIDNCQVATSLHLASRHGGACIGMRLFIPESWADDPERRAKAGIPEDLEHQTKLKLAVNLIDHALEWGLTPRPVIADAGYGDSTEFRKDLEDRGLEYVLRVSGTAVVWPPGTCPQEPSPKPPGVRGRRRTKWVAPEGVAAVSIARLAESLPSSAFRRITWGEGTRGPQSRRFAFLRVRTAHRHGAGQPPGEEQWLVCEWSFSKGKPTAFYLSNLPKQTPRKQLVYLAKIRWRIERDYQEMKSELGLDHFEGRTWQGFHHHAALVAAAHAFLTLHRAFFSPEEFNFGGERGRRLAAPADLPGFPRAASGSAPADARPLPDMR
jgi:SRSO17 transposase